MKALLSKFSSIPFALLIFLLDFNGIPAPLETPSIRVGAERMNQYLPLLEGKRVALVVNPSSRVGNSHLIDTLQHSGVHLVKIFSPEHGLRGNADAGAEVQDGIDHASRLPIVSLYGGRKKPSAGDMEGIDVVVFDIQDVGARFYTYISTLYYIEAACAENSVSLLVLDRPNPNGHYIDGPVLGPAFKSFVGIAPIPLVHGCTVGELALLFAGEGYFQSAEKLDLSVINCSNYKHSMPYMLPVKPSPNLPDYRSVLLYPSICLFEGTSYSVGRGTDTPFQVFGHPDAHAGPYEFTPRPHPGANAPLYEGRQCRGFDLRTMPIDSLYTLGRLDLHWLIEAYQAFPDKKHFFLANNFFDKLAGTDQLRIQIERGDSELEIRQTWADGLLDFRQTRSKYLLYND